MSKLIVGVEVAPYWNVNDIKPLKGVNIDAVEVAPYWNVNLNLNAFPKFVCS